MKSRKTAWLVFHFVIFTNIIMISLVIYRMGVRNVKCLPIETFLGITGKWFSKFFYDHWIVLSFIWMSLLTPTVDAWVEFSAVFMWLSVSLSVSPHDISKNDASMITKLDPLALRRYRWQQKTRLLGIPYSVVCVILYVADLIKCRHVTDGQTDIHTITAYTALA